jgi:DNA-binding IclR family transcriptional regulator
MSSVIKTLDLLSYFSIVQPEIGLSQLSKLAKRDKATTHRHLKSLEISGFIEQNVKTKLYCLGPAVLKLAQIREATVPRKAGARKALAELSQATGETAHVSILSGSAIISLDFCESSAHSTRAHIDIETLPLHATASGLCILAFGPTELLNTAQTNLQKFTPQTTTTVGALTQNVRQTNQEGFGRANRTFDDEVAGLAAPIFDQTGTCVGAVAVASVATRYTPNHEHNALTNLFKASREITLNWGGTIPPLVENNWAKSLSQAQTMEAIE